MSPTVIALEVGLAVLLIAALIYSIRLDKKLKVLRDRQAELAKIVSEFNQAAERAEGSIHTLQQTSLDAGRDLDHRIQKANALSEELRLLTELGESRADRLSQTAVQRPTAPAAASAYVTAPSAAEPSASYSGHTDPILSNRTTRSTRPLAGRDSDDLFEDVSASDSRLDRLRHVR